MDLALDARSDLDAEVQPPPKFSILATGLTKSFGPKTVVEAIDLRVREGEFFGFLGPNGAGKSTTIKMLVGLLRPTAGRIVIAGRDLAVDPLGVKAHIGVLPEELNLYERLTCEEFLHFAGSMYGLSEEVTEQRTEELLEVLALAEHRDKLIVDYSHGMKKKTALAAALIHDPRVLFLDEPFEGIDAVSGRVIRAVLQQLTQRGVTIFFSSHIMEIVERLCTEVAIINAGRIVGIGSLADLRVQSATGENGSLEDVFLRLVGAGDERESLSWVK